MGLTYNLGQAHKRMLLKQSSIMKKYGLTARQALIIAYLSTHKKEVVTQKVLEDHLHLTNPTITVMDRRFYQGVSDTDMKIFQGVLGKILKNLDTV